MGFKLSYKMLCSNRKIHKVSFSLTTNLSEKDLRRFANNWAKRGVSGYPEAFVTFIENQGYEGFISDVTIQELQSQPN